MTRITEGHLVRHYQGVKGGRDAALLDIAPDHTLHLLHKAGLFQNDLVFKGGTALRKFRAGNSGRFSTDLDFAAPDENLALTVLQALDGAKIDGFAFAIDNLGRRRTKGRPSHQHSLRTATIGRESRTGPSYPESRT